MPLLYNKRALLAKTETTYGIDPTPTGAANAILVKNLDVTPIDAEQVDRNLIRPYFGASDILIANVRSKISFEVEMAGAGAAGTAPGYGPILKACGMAETITPTTKVAYSPVSESFSSCTIYINVDGVTHKIKGCRGTVNLSMVVGQIPTFKFEMMGIYQSPVDMSFSSMGANYTGFQAPLVFNNINSGSFQFYSYAAELQSLEMAVGMDMVYRELVGNTKEVLLTNRKTTGTVQFDAVTMATKDYFSVATTSGSTGNLTVTHGTVGGNKVKLTVPRANATTVNYVEANGIAQYTVPYVALPNTTGTGDNEFSIEVL
jgi:hypothetical protein